MDGKEEAAQQASMLGGAAGRPLSFDEMDAAGQIQALRREALVMRELVNSQQALIDRLMVHVHAADGQMLVPMRASGIGGAMSGRNDPLR